MADPVRFKFKKISEKPVILHKKTAGHDETEYINNTSNIIEKPKKRKTLTIPHKENLWKPGGNVDSLTKEAIEQLINSPQGISENSLISIEKPQGITPSLKFPGIVPQKESSADDYNDVPVTSFGEALMRGMGWEKGQGVGRKRKLVEPIDFETKKRTLGVTIHEEEIAEASRIYHEFKLGDYVEVVGGQDKGKHAKILSLSLETARCIVRLPSDEVVDLALINITKGSREQYLKLRDLDQTDAEVFKKPHEQSERPMDGTSLCNKSSSHVFDSRLWLHQDLKVRIVCQNYLGGKYYCKKVDVVDIIDSKFCICRDMHGRILENVPNSILETVIPKDKGSLVMILSGHHRFQIAELEEKNSKQELAVCITSLDKDVISVPFNQVCQYIGTSLV